MTALNIIASIVAFLGGYMATLGYGEQAGGIISEAMILGGIALLGCSIVVNIISTQYKKVNEIEND